MLHISDKQMPWSVQESGTLGWVNDKQFLSELGTQVELEEARIRATVHTFYEERLLSKIQEETTRSRLSIIVFDDRRPTQPPTRHYLNCQSATREQRTGSTHSADAGSFSSGNSSRMCESTYYSRSGGDPTTKPHLVVLVPSGAVEQH
jgi:hypothetical protein